MWSEHLHLVHIGHQGDGGTSAHSTPPTEEQGAPRGCQDPLDPANVVKELVEEEYVQFMMLTSCVRSQIYNTGQSCELCAQGW